MPVTPTPNYYAPTGGHPPQTQITADRAVFTEAYALIPKGVMRDIVTSQLPFWEGTRLWVLARPLSGFAETVLAVNINGKLAPDGGSETKPRDWKTLRPEKGKQVLLFIVDKVS